MVRCTVHSFTSNTVHLLYWAGSAIFLASKCVLICSGSSRYYSPIDNKSVGSILHLNRSTRRTMRKMDFFNNNHNKWTCIFLNCYVWGLTSYFIGDKRFYHEAYISYGGHRTHCSLTNHHFIFNSSSTQDTDEIIFILALSCLRSWNLEDLNNSIIHSFCFRFWRSEDLGLFRDS